MYEFHVSRLAREKYNFDLSMFGFDGNVIFANLFAARKFTQKINQHRDLVNFPEKAVSAGDINAIGLIDEIMHLVVSLYRKTVDENIMAEALEDLEEQFGEEELNKAFVRFTETFPPIDVYKGEISAEEYLQSQSKGTPNTHITLEEMMMLWLVNKNPAVMSFLELFDDTVLSQSTIYRDVIESLQEFFKHKPFFGPDNQDLISMLRSPAVEEPYSLTRQLEYIRRKWGALIGDYLYRLLNALDLIEEEKKSMFGGPGPAEVPSYESITDEENFSPDSDWMPRTVMIAKNTYVWLYQLSKAYDQEIKRLDQIPDEALDKLSQWGFNGLWLIGLWERSDASKRIKQLCGNPEAVASAYSLKNYSISSDLGGESAYENLRDRAAQRGIRLASDMVPNHMGIDSDWVLNHPEWFISLPYSPFPSYSFNGPNLSPKDNVDVFIEDHYYDRTDAAVVFKHIDHNHGVTRFIYHGNDGTSMPWNDTAQLDYLNSEVREAVIQTILQVARRFPIIRFDAAMTLAKKHYQRLWFPEPGSGGAIPSRAEHGLTRDAFNRAFPNEFWREVVDRVAEEVPDTLLLAEAFWLMEGYFVRTLGMHRVYNSAFMNMLRNEENSKYRNLIKNTLEFDPEILKRYVNFMNNPDEKTAVDQFGKGEKYFGICTLMATMPGLPMFGHGQIEGYAEKYGMEYYRPYWDEEPDKYLIHRHQQAVFPLLKRRDLFSGVNNFLLYDFYTGDGYVDENVFAYSNGNGHQNSLVIYHNRFGSTNGWIQSSASFLNKSTGNLENRKLHEGLNISGQPNRFTIFKDSESGMEFIRSSREIQEKGLYFNLNAYEHHVFIDFREVEENANGQYSQLYDYLNGRGVPSIDIALKELMLAPILNPLQALINVERLRSVFRERIINKEDRIDSSLLGDNKERYSHFINSLKNFMNVNTDSQALVKSQQKGFEALLQLAVFENRYPFPGSQKYKEVLAYISKNLDDDPFVWYVFTLWNDLRLMGKVITHEPQYAEISRSWIDEWGVSRLIQQKLEDLGLDAEQAKNGVTIIKLLVDQQNWVVDIEQKTPQNLIEGWISKEIVRDFLKINRYRDKLWFNKEAFEALMWWMMATGLLQMASDPEKSLTSTIEDLFEAWTRVKSILKAETASAYQLEKLLEGLK
ncbi:MAG: alpha-amylase family glycosyl hydrolase [Chloroflexota bacterium]|nr:alpha-amylase family glycosyl hydrolase [Chloroflexota bacterium]